MIMEWYGKSMCCCMNRLLNCERKEAPRDRPGRFLPFSIFYCKFPLFVL